MAAHHPSIGLTIAAMLLLGTSAACADNTCYCRASTGAHVAVGETACLKTNGGLREARCGYVLNNTAWKFTGNACPLASHDSGQGKKAELATVLGR